MKTAAHPLIKGIKSESCLISLPAGKKKKQQTNTGGDGCEARAPHGAAAATQCRKERLWGEGQDGAALIWV